MGHRPKLGTPCRDCGVTAFPLSQDSLCPYCGMRRVQAAIEQLQKGEGPIYDKWASRLAAAVQGRDRHG